VVLLDLEMPGMNGCQVARRLHRQLGMEAAVLVDVLGAIRGREGRRPGEQNRPGSRGLDFGRLVQ
jgi:CheY-like chemotaxis protein